jgi:hypothetical protein
MTATIGTDHETALAAGFDIVSPGRWVRPDSAEVRRDTIPGEPRYTARRPGRVDYRHSVLFYTMREAVEWIGPVRP